MINFDDYANENKTQHNLKWPNIPDHPYRILIIGGWGSGKRNALLTLIKNRPDIGKIYLYAKDPYEAKYQFLINKKESTGLKHFNDKYKYLTGEETLPSDQQQIIEKAKFTYSPLEKAFEKQIQTIEYQGEKQIKAIQDRGQVKKIKKCNYDDKDTPLISKQKEIFNELVDERLQK